MLRKLTKYQMRASAKILLIAYLAVIVVGILIGLVIEPGMLREDGVPTVAALTSIVSFFLYFMVIGGVTFSFYIYIGIRFYRNMYSNEAYLTHTVPVKPASLLNAHVITGTIWSIILIAAIFLSLLGMAGGAGIMDKIPSAKELLAYYDVSGITALLYILQYLIVGSLSGILLIYLSVCIGSLFAPHKVLASIVAYILLNIFMQLLSILVVILSSAFRNIFLMSINDVYPPKEFLSIMTGVEILAVVQIAVCWIVSRIIVSKHLNLE